MDVSTFQLGLAILHDIYSQNFCNCIWIFKVNNIKLQAATKSFVVALSYKINPTQNTTNITEITKNSLNLVPCTYFKIGEKFLQIFHITIQCNLTLLTFSSYCHKFLRSTGVQSEQLIAHNLSIVVKENAVLQTCDISFIYAHNNHWCHNCNWELLTS